MTATDERKLAISGRAEEWRREGLIGEAVEREIAARNATSWRANGLLLQLVFFFLATIALAAFFGLCHALRLPQPGLFTAAAGIGIAEYLMHARRTGADGRRRGVTRIEDALWLGGGLALISELPPSGKPEANLVIAAVFAAAGVRVRNPVFGAVAAIFVMIWSEQRFDVGTIAAVAVATVAMVALLREWQRPSTEWLMVTVMLALPVAGRFAADARWRSMTIAVYAIFGAVALALAITRRHHAFFLAALLGLSIAAVEAARTIALALEAKLAIAGALLLAIAFAASHALRHRETGLVLAPAVLTPFDDELQTVATLAGSAGQREPAPQPPAADGGGSFGGAGASGEF